MLLPWLSSTFADLKRTLEAGAEAVLLSGPAGLGKRILAQHLAGWRLCESPRAEGPCGECGSCHLISAGNHPDLLVLEPATEAVEEGAESAEEGGAKTKPKAARYIVVAQIRELILRLELAPHSPAGRVIIIDPAAQMNLAAANSLLKTLEEPPPRTIFILVTAAEERLPATVRSRCRRVALGLPATEVAVAWLESQGVTGARDALRLAGGAPLVARALIDTDLMERWKVLIRNLDARSLQSAVWDTTPEGLARLCQVLQLLCVDLLRTAAGAAPKYADASHKALAATGRQLAPAAVSDYWRELGRIRNLIQHPLNGSLVRDQMLLGYQRLFDT